MCAVLGRSCIKTKTLKQSPESVSARRASSNRGRDPPDGFQRLGSKRQGLAVARLQRDAFVKACERVLYSVELHQRQAAIVVRGSDVRIDLDRLADLPLRVAITVLLRQITPRR